MSDISVLIVEDNPTQQALLFKLAGKAGVHAMAVSSGREAIDALMRVRYSLVFMDWSMMQMDGLECAARIRDLEIGTGKRIPIVAMSVNVHNTAREECLAAGMDDYIAKPFTLEQFKAKIDQWSKVAQTVPLD